MISTDTTDLCARARKSTLAACSLAALAIAAAPASARDGMSAASNAPSVLTQAYYFNDGLNDVAHALPLTADGGSLAGQRFVFGPEEGLTLTNALAQTDSYSVVIGFRFDTPTSGWTKLIDFQEQSSDDGLYINSDNNVIFWSNFEELAGVGIAAPGVENQIVVTVDGQVTIVYLNGVTQMTLGEANSVPATNVLKFFLDDFAFNDNDQPGSINYLLVYDGVLTGAEVAPPVPAHSYGFDGNFADDTGAQALLDQGGSIVGDRYFFGPNEGLIFDGALAQSDSFAVEMVLEMDSGRTSYTKLLDYSGLQADEGLYFVSGYLRWYAETPFLERTVAADVDQRILLTVSEGMARIHNGVGESLSFPWTPPTPLPDRFHFLMDDVLTGMTEAHSGSVDLIRIYPAGLTLAQAAALPQLDDDNDSHQNAADNCIQTSNPMQLDADGDGYGNACDTDLNDDGVTNLIDLVQFKSLFGTDSAIADFNGDGIVNLIDLIVLKNRFGLSPGPSSNHPG